MECNKDEALRAKSIAEDKIDQKDFAGAKRFALKAQNLYPPLDGISQMLTMLDVYISAEKKISGQVDWYGVLGVNPSADDEMVKKQYRKLALMLHPDKNKSLGADGAFKLISEAWSLLSDKMRRSAYNQITGFKGLQQKAPTHTGGPSAAHTGRPFGSPWARSGGPSACAGPSARSSAPPEPSTESPFSKFANKKPPAPKSRKKSTKAGPSKPSASPMAPATAPAPTPSNQMMKTFWTICNLCRIQYEYHLLYRNTTLLCIHCEKPFVALEIPRPVTKSNSHKLKQQQNASNNLRTPSANDRGKDVDDAQKSGMGQVGPSVFKHAAYQKGSPSSTSVDTVDTSLAAKVASFVNLGEKLKRAVNTDANSSVGTEGLTKKRKLDEVDVNAKNHKLPEGNVNFGTASNLDSARELTHHEMRKLLMRRGQEDVLVSLNMPSSEGPAITKPAENQKDKMMEKHKRDGNNHKKANSDSSADKQKGETKEKHRNNGNNHKKANSDSSADNEGKRYSGTVTMNVPDPDFYDFDQDRAENSFADNDVWAAYDDDDGMPRFYALIHKVISKKPFKLRMSWLNSKTTAEFGNLDWVGSGFYKTCGEFRVGKHEICKFVNAFSQRVNWSKGPRGSILILPQKGDVWALYRNWSPEWNTHTPDDIVHKYDMAMVLEDYDEDRGVVVTPLIKVVGYRTVFCPNTNDESIIKIPKEDIFRLSHRVPHHAVTSLEAPNAPEGCVELDPAATPLELLGMTMDTNGALNGESACTSVMESIAVTGFEEIGGGNGRSGVKV